MKLNNTMFPVNKSVFVLTLALHANGTSSYRDAGAISTFASSLWGASGVILTDEPDQLQAISPHTRVVHVTSKESLLAAVGGIIATIKPGVDVLFTISSHGYSMVLPERCPFELNKRTEYLSLAGEKIMDFELFNALYDHMHADIKSLCLIDTCHSGTMLDLEHLSRDGDQFLRTHTQLCATPRPFSVCISACADNENAGEDIGRISGWGGKLTCYFLDFLQDNKPEWAFNVCSFYKKIHGVFTHQTAQRTHPLISFNGNP